MDERRKRIKAEIDKRGMTYTQLEELTGTAKSSIQRYIVGETDKIPVDFIEKLADVLDVSAAYLACFDKPKAQSIEAQETTAVAGEICTSAKVLTIIETKTPTADGREILQYWTLDGEFMFADER